MILIAASNKDVAGLNIKKQILSNYSFTEKSQDFASNPAYEANIKDKHIELVTLDSETIYAQNLPDSFTNLELIVFISRHSSISGIPTLSVHTPGNFAEAELGGIPRTVSISPANMMRETLKALDERQKKMRLDYQVSYECTHHGPSFNTATMYVELGSSPKQWGDTEAAKAVAQATMEALRQFGKYSAKSVIGIGGPHYNAKFTRMALENEIAFGHMIPKYAISRIDAEILKQCIERTMEKVETIILDWKGIKSEDRPGLMEAISDTQVKFEKT